MKMTRTFLGKAVLGLTVLTPLLTLAACAAAPSGSTTPATTGTPASTTPPGTSATASSVTVNLVAQNIAFDQSTITVPAGAKVTVNFDNKDAQVPHNFSVYTNSSATTSIFVGAIVTGPGTTTYNFTAPTTPGTYFFRCDVHPTIMTGSLVVK
jgi:plastocyanin